MFSQKITVSSKNEQSKQPAFSLSDVLNDT